MPMDCPHCYVRVFPDDDGTCPSCGKNVNDLTGVDPAKTTLVVQAGSTMPDVCCHCGFPTRRSVKVKAYAATRVAGAAADSGSDSVASGCLLVGTAVIPIPFLSSIISLAAGGPGGTSHDVYELVIRVPQCRECSKSKITPISADLLRRTMKLVVDKRFKEHYEGANSR